MNKQTSTSSNKRTQQGKTQASIPFKKVKETTATPMDTDSTSSKPDTSTKKQKGKNKTNPYAIDVNKSIPTKPHENYFDIIVSLKKRYQNIDTELCTKPYTTLLSGEEDDDPLSFHNDLSFLVKAVGRLHYDTNAMLEADQLKAVKNDIMTTTEWVNHTSVIITTPQDAEEYLTPEDVVNCCTIMSRLSYTPIGNLVQAQTKTVPPSLHTKAWYASNINIGSYFAKPKDSRQSSITEGFATQRRARIDESKNTTQAIDTPMDVDTPTDANPANPSPDSTKLPSKKTPSEPTPALASALKNAGEPTAVKDTANIAQEKRQFQRRYTVKLYTPASGSKKGPKEVLVSVLLSIYEQYHRLDPRAIILPWNVSDMSSMYPISDPRTFPKNITEMRPFMSSAFPKPNSHCWFKINIACDENPDNFLSQMGQPLFDFFDDIKCGMYYATVHDSDDTVEVAMLCYQGPFTDHHRLTDVLRKQSTVATNNKRPLRLGVRVRTVKEVPSKNKSGGNWNLRDNQLPVIEADRQDAKAVKNFLYNLFNTGKTFAGYMTRALPVKTQLTTGTNGDLNFQGMLGKHVAVMSVLVIIRTYKIAYLDRKLNSGNGTTTCREILQSLTFPLQPKAGETTKPLLHSVDHATSGNDKKTGVVYITTYKDRADLAERLIDILPKYLAFRFDHTLAMKCIHPQHYEECPSITWGASSYSEWDGTWSTTEDAQLQSLLEEDLGFAIELEGMENVLLPPGPIEPVKQADDHSFSSFGTVLRGTRSNSPQQQDEATSADDSSAQTTESTTGGQERAIWPHNSSGTSGRQHPDTQSLNQPCCNINEEDNEPYFGDLPGPVHRNHFRIGGVNINNLPFDKRDQKNEQFFKAILKYGLDIILIQELGINWRHCSRESSFRERVDEWLDNSITKSKVNFNTHDRSHELRQWGGTGIITHGKLSHYSAGAGADKTGLGRWTWVRYQGKHNVTLRVVSIYRPCESKSSPSSVYNQHKRYFLENNDSRNPRTAFLEDLDKELTAWISAGDQILIQGDVNESVFHTSITALFERHQMRNLIFDRHDSSQAPKTYFRSSEGRIVDGMWGTTGLVVEQGGYLEPGDFPSDHSLLWIDVSYHNALGHQPLAPIPPSARRLQLRNSRVVDKYLNEYESLIEAARLPQRQQALNLSIQTGKPLTQIQRDEAEAIDALKTKLMLKAEKKCRKLRMGEVSFSEATEKPRREVAFWQLAIRRRLGLPVSSRLWKRRKKKANIIEDIRSLSLPQIYDKQKQAKLDYRKAKKEHDDSRLKFIDTFPAKDRDRIRRHEEQRKIGRLARLVTGKLTSKSVTKVIVNGTECTNKKEIESALFDVNEAKYQASATTPFLQQPLVDCFGYRSSEPANSEVLDGTFIAPPNTDPYAKLLLHHLCRPDDATVTTAASTRATDYNPVEEISVTDHIKGWKKAKERTSAGASGLTFAMYKAHTKRDRLARLDAHQRSFAYKTGFAYRRWKKGINVQLLKRKRDYRAEKLRTILLLEADFNINNKVIGRDAMKRGERHGLLTPDNYGGRKRLQAVEVGLNQQLTYNSILARRGRAVVMSNDAKGCYDRIAHVVVSLALQRLGIPKPAIDSMIEAIQEMDHYVRTAFGDSDDSYGNNPYKPPPSGVLQGNGAGPAGWFAIATILIEIMRAAGFGYKQWSVIRQRACHIVCFAFVDDTDLIHCNDTPGTTTEQLLEESQAALDMWSGLLAATGGALAPEKSYWYLVEVIRKNGKWKFATANDRPGSLYLEHGQYRIKRQEPHQSNEALGIQVCPNGSMDAELAYLKSKVSVWCDAVRTKKLYAHEAWYCLNSTIMNTLEYPLTATSFSKSQLDKLMRPLLRAALPLCGIQRRMPRALVYGTLRSQGLTLRHPYHTQLIRHLHSLMIHGWRQTPTRDLHEENMDLVQLHVGSDQPFWSLPFELYGPLAPPGWMKNTWESLSSTPLQLTGPCIVQPSLREHDVHLMDAFLDLEPSPLELQTLQDCRLHLRVYALSEITNAAGTALLERPWNGQPSTDLLTTSWINTYRPGPNAWTLWQDFLRRAFLTPHTQHKRLRRPLKQFQPSSYNRWVWWISGDKLYQQVEPNCWHRWSFLSIRNHQRKFQHPIPVTHPPNLATSTPANVLRITTRVRDTATILTTWTTPRLPPPAPPATLEEALLTLPSSKAWAVEKLQRSDDGESFAEAIQRGTAIAISDGSLKADYGTAAFILTSDVQENPIRGVNIVPGPLKDGDSHRAELAGLYAIFVLVECIVSLHQLTSGSILIGCDNQSAIGSCDQDFIPHTRHQNFDFLHAIRSFLLRSPLTWHAQHIHGHQDTKNPGKPLTFLEQLNVHMDSLAKSYWFHIVSNSTIMPSPPIYEIADSGWQLWKGTKKIVAPSADNIYEAIADAPTQYHWIRHNRFPEEHLPDIDWDASHRLLHRLPTTRRFWITKHASENCGVGSTMVSWKFQTDATCPRCSHPQEDTTHVLKCQGYDANAVFESSMTTLADKLTELETDPHIQTSLLYAIRQWRLDQPVLLTHMDPSIAEAVRTQHSIGWKTLLEGLPCTHWQNLQSHHYVTHGIKRSSKKWLDALLTQLHHLAWNQWNHRNDVKHRQAKPEYQRAVRKLNAEIRERYLKGPTSVRLGDRHYLQINLSTILSKTVTFRKHWLLNIIAAQEFKLRQDTADQTANTRTPRTDGLHRYFPRMLLPPSDNQSSTAS